MVTAVAASTPIVARKPIQIVTRTKSTDRRFRMLLYGQAGIGKTTFGYKCHSSAGKSLIIASERGYDFLGDVDVVDVGEWRDFTDAIDQLPLGDYETTVVDNLLSLADMVQFSVCKTMGITHPGDLDRGKAYDQIGLLAGVWFHKLSQKARNIIWTCPERSMQVKSAAGISVVRVMPDAPTSTLRIVLNGVEFVGHAEEGKGGQRTINFVPSQDREAKDRKGLVKGGVFPLDGRAFYDLVTANAVGE